MDVEQKINIGRAVKAAADILLPRVCMVCGRKLLVDESFMCIYCSADLPLTHFWQMQHNPMADRFNAKIQEHIDEFVSVGYAPALALFHFQHDNGYRHIPYELKYKGNIPAGKYFAGMLADKIADCAWLQDIDAVIPVPLHWLRRLKRGYNQSEVIGSVIARRLLVPLRTDILLRNRRTKTQTKLTVAQKAANVHGAFSVNPRTKMPALRHILIVDDVFTTGSTLCECYRPLRHAFPEAKISVATLAFV